MYYTIIYPMYYTIIYPMYYGITAFTQFRPVDNVQRPRRPGELPRQFGVQDSQGGRPQHIVGPQERGIQVPTVVMCSSVR